VLLLRNYVQLLLLDQRFHEAKRMLDRAQALCNGASSPRTQAAVDVARALYESNTGLGDIAITRLSNAVDRFRGVWPNYQEALVGSIAALSVSGRTDELFARRKELELARLERIDRQSRGLIEFLRPESAIRETLGGAALANGDAHGEWEIVVQLAIGHGARADQTGAHALRVAEISRLLARAIGMTDAEARLVSESTLVHDIGMVGVEGMDGHPYTEINTQVGENPSHGEAGWRILSSVLDARAVMARDVARFHHMWWRSAGSESTVDNSRIPLAARICAVADEFDCIMLRNAGGGREKSIGAALDCLQRLSGSRCDPQLVAALRRALQHEVLNEGYQLYSENGCS
jgi:response regulator RpfG family c-di-GMP phosphodiesterase